jgi:uncharacterized protein GlcG (DUF336 family)
MLKRLLTAGAMACLCSTVAVATPTPLITVPPSCAEHSLTSTDYATFKAKLAFVVALGKGVNGGQGNNMWATIVARNGTVCAVAFSGSSLTDQWLASRVISAQKAFTANSLSLGAVSGASTNGKFALSTANLYSAVQPGGNFYGLQHSNPVAAAEAYGDKFDEDETHTATYGMPTDPMVGLVIGGINVFGGGLALYSSGSARVGGVGVSGDQACADHMVAWQLRHALNLDLLATGGISGPAGGMRPDNIIFDITPNPNGGTGISASGFGHPMCINTKDPTTLPAVQ